MRVRREQTWGLPEVAGWLAVAALGLVVGSYSAQLLQDPPPSDTLPTPPAERVVHWLLPPRAPDRPAAPHEAAVAFELGAPSTEGPAPVELLRSSAGQAELPLEPSRTMIARAVLTEVRFVPRPPAPAPARASVQAPTSPSGEPDLVDTRVIALSSFSPDPQADGWRLTRAALAEGRLPDPAAVRIEDLVNAQPTEIPPPVQGEPLAVDLELAPHPWRAGRHLLRLGLRAAPAPVEQAPLPRQLTVLVDTSGSMGLDSRLAQVQAGLQALVDHLGPQDRLTLVSFAEDAHVQVAASEAAAAGAAASGELRLLIDALSANGASATAAALRRAGQQALRHYHPGADNRVVLITDGEANVGMTELDGALESTATLAALGITLDVVVVGSGEASSAPVAELAARGRGRLLSFDGFQEARRTLSRELLEKQELEPGRHEVTVAFSPQAVQGWHLFGHDGSSAGAELAPLELSPGQAITALYELALTPAFLASGLDNSLGEVRLASLGQQGDAVARLVVEVPRRLLRGDFAAASRDLRVSLAAAAFGSLLRHPPAQAEPWQQVAALVHEDRGEDRALRRMILQSGRLASRQAPRDAAADAPAQVDPTLLLRRVQRAEESLGPCLQAHPAPGGARDRLELGLELQEGAVVEVQARLPGARAELLDCVSRTARGWRFPSSWSAHLDLPLELEQGS